MSWNPSQFAAPGGLHNLPTDARQPFGAMPGAQPPAPGGIMPDQTVLTHAQWGALGMEPEGMGPYGPSLSQIQSWRADNDNEDILAKLKALQAGKPAGPAPEPEPEPEPHPTFPPVTQPGVDENGRWRNRFSTLPPGVQRRQRQERMGLLDKLRG